MEKVRRVLEFCVENGVMMAAGVVGNMAMQDVGEDEGRWAIACICNQCLVRKCYSLGRIPMITVSTHFGNERAMDCCSSMP